MQRKPRCTSDERPQLHESASGRQPGRRVCESNATKRTQQTPSKPGAANPRPRRRAAFDPRRANEANATRQRHERARCHGGQSRGGGGTLCAEAAEPRQTPPQDAQNGRRDGQKRRPDERGEATGRPSRSGPGGERNDPHKTSEGRGPAQQTNGPQKKTRRDPRQTPGRHTNDLHKQGEQAGGRFRRPPRGIAGAFYDGL